MAGLSGRQIRKGFPNGRRIFGFDQDSDHLIVADPVQYRLGIWEKQKQAATAIRAFGIQTPTATAASTATIRTTQSHWIRYGTAAVLNDWCGWTPNAWDITRPVDLPSLRMSVMAPATFTNTRWWLGLFDQLPAGFDDPAIHLAGFRFSTAAGDTNWMTCTNDGVAGGTQVDSGVAFAASTRYDLGLTFRNSGTVSFVINDEVIGAITTDIPGATTGIGIGMILQTLGAATRYIFISHAALTCL